MKEYSIQNSHFAKQGFTHVFEIDHATDLTESTDNTDQAIVLTGLLEGDIVFPECIIDVVEDPAGLTALNASVGVTGALTQLTASTSVLAGATNAVVSGSGNGPYPTVAAGKNLEINFDPAANTEALTDLTAGKFRVWVRISRRAERANVSL